MRFSRDGRHLLSQVSGVFLDDRPIVPSNAAFWDFLHGGLQGYGMWDGPETGLGMYFVPLSGVPVTKVTPGGPSEDVHSLIGFWTDGGDRWLGQYTFGAKDSDGHAWPDRRALATSRQGDWIFVSTPSYTKLYVRRADGTEFEQEFNAYFFVGGMDSGVLHIQRVGDPKSQLLGDLVAPVDLPAPASLVKVGTRFAWAGYMPGWGLCAGWIDEAPMGRSFSTDPKDFNSVIALRDDGKLVVGSGETQGEWPQRLYEVESDWSFSKNGGPRVSPPVVNLLIPPVVLPDIAPLPGKSLAPFKDPEGHTTAAFEIVVNGAAPKGTRPRFVATDAPSLAYFRPGVDAGLYTEASTVADLKQAIALATKLKTRLLWCHDGTSVDRELIKLLRPFDIVALECYRMPGETAPQAQDRCTNNMSILLGTWPNILAVIVQDYDMGGLGPDEVWPVADTVIMFDFGIELSRHDSRIRLLCPFEIQRGNGADAHPELMEMTHRANAACDNQFKLLPVVDPAPPVAFFRKATRLFQ